MQSHRKKFMVESPLIFKCAAQNGNTDDWMGQGDGCEISRVMAYGRSRPR